MKEGKIVIDTLGFFFVVKCCGKLRHFVQLLNDDKINESLLLSDKLLK